MAPTNKRVLISGAGVAGLTAGLWLARAGFEPIVVERAASVRAGGFLVSLSHHAYHFADELGLLEGLRRRDAGIGSSGYVDERGKLLLELDYGPLFGRLDVVQLMRDDLVAELAAMAANEFEIRFGERVVDLPAVDAGTPQVASLQQGGDEEFGAVIGADGLDSAVRNLAFSPELVERDFLGLHCAAFRLPNVLGLSGRFETHMQRDRYMAVFSTGSEDLGAVFVWDDPARSLRSDVSRRELLHEAFAGSAGATAQALEHAPEESFYMDVLSQVKLPSWSAGNAVLVGDAAHCLTLFSGRGAAAAFAGASRLAQAVIAHDGNYQSAFADYEAQMRPVISSIQPATRRAVPLYVPRTAFRHFARGQLMRWLPNAFFRQYFRWKYSKV